MAYMYIKNDKDMYCMEIKSSIINGKIGNSSRLHREFPSKPCLMTPQLNFYIEEPENPPGNLLSPAASSGPFTVFSKNLRRVSRRVDVHPNPSVY